MGRLQNIGGFRTQSKELAQFASVVQREFDNVYRTMPSASSTSEGTTAVATAGGGVSAADRARWDYAYNWVSTYTPPTVLHNSLTDLQGGTAGEYYHFNATQHTELALFSSEFAVAAGTGYASLSLADISEVFRVESEPGANQVGIYFGRPGSTIPPGAQGSYMAFFRAPASGTYNHALGLAAGKTNGEILHLYNWQDAHILRFNTDGNEELSILGTTKAGVNQWLMTLGATPTQQFLGSLTVGSVTGGTAKLNVVSTGYYQGIKIDSSATSAANVAMLFYVAASAGRRRNWMIATSDNLFDDLTFRVSAAELGDPTSGTIVMQLLGSYSGAKAVFHQTAALRAAVALTALNKAGASYLTVGARNTAGSEMVFDLSTIGTITFSQSISPHIATSVTNGYIDVRANGTGDIAFNYGTSGTGGLKWYGGGTTAKIQMTSTGRLGIGSVAPNVPLQVIGGAIGSVPAAGTYGGAAIFSADANTYGVFIGAITSGVGYIQVQSGASATTYSLLLQPNGGNVGIGTTSPTAVLHVDGNSLFSHPTGAASVSIRPSAAGNAGSLSLYDYTWGYSVVLYQDSAGNASLNSTGPLYIGTNSATRMTVTTSGKIGIATTSPSYALDVNGEIRGWYGYFNGEGLSTDLRVGGVYNMLGLYVASGYDMMFALGWDGSFKFNRGSNTKAYIDYAGKFWGHQVYVEQSTAASGLYVSGDGVTPQLELYDAYASESTIYHTTGITWVAYDYSFPLYSGTFLLVNGSGNVGIGTTSPSSMLDVRGTINSQVTSTDTIIFNGVAGLNLVNLSATNNNYTVIGFLDSASVIAGGIAVRFTNHTSHYGNMHFGIRGASGWTPSALTILSTWEVQTISDILVGEGTSGTGQRYMNIRPEASNQGGIVIRDGTTSKWGLFKTTGNDFLLYNYGLSANAILIDDSTGALTFYGPSASLDKSQSAGETAYWVKNGATRAINNRASLVLNLGANTASSWVIRARQTATSDGAHSLEFYAPDGTLFFSHANGAASPNIPDYVQGVNAGDGYSYIRGTDGNVYYFDGSAWQPL